MNTKSHLLGDINKSSESEYGLTREGLYFFFLTTKALTTKELEALNSAAKVFGINSPNVDDLGSQERNGILMRCVRVSGGTRTQLEDLAEFFYSKR